MSRPIADPSSLLERSIYMVGIKGSGMAALADMLTRLGTPVRGSDTDEQFFTDELLRRAGIPVTEGFTAENVPADAELVIYSAAYDPDTHPELTEARRRGLPLLTYTEALGVFSAGRPSAAIAGVHGKTSTAALAATLVRELGLPGSALVGSVVPSLEDSGVYVGGERFFIAETCEYKRHFLSFHPDVLVVTNVEPDHLDYFTDYADIRDAFVELGRRLPGDGVLVYCADDAGAVDVAGRIGAERPELRVLAYGESACGPYTVRDVAVSDGVLGFRIGDPAAPGAPAGPSANERYELRVPGRHNALNTAAALAAVATLAERLGNEARAAVHAGAPGALRAFRGSARRSELVGEAGGVTVIDDYAHHPTAIRLTLAGLREFYPGRRLIVDFMSHTYTRTAALLEEFAGAFGEADVVILHRIYASARERFDGKISGKDLYHKVRAAHPGRVEYRREVLEAVPLVLSLLEPGDILVTMGAGDNWRLGRAVLQNLKNDPKSDNQTRSHRGG